MATSLALKKVLISSALLPNSLHRLAAPASHPAASRLFSTYTNNAPDVRASTSWGEGRVGRLADRGSGILPESHAWETKDKLSVWMDMPGLSKENVKITMDMEQKALLIKARVWNLKDERSSSEEWDPESQGRRFSSSIDLPEKLNTDQIKAEMKNGVLKVVMPKVKEEERSDVFHVQVADPESGVGFVEAVVVVVVGSGVVVAAGFGLWLVGGWAVAALGE